MQLPAFPQTMRPIEAPKVSKKNPRAEWTTDERLAWEQGMKDAIDVALSYGDTVLADLIAEAQDKGPMA